MDFLIKPETARIDYIFVKNGMKVLEHRTIVKKEHGIFISDHWPVEAVIRLTKIIITNSLLSHSYLRVLLL